MNLIVSPSNNPYTNLATEELLIKEKREDYLFFYINEPSIVVGKHQIIVSEINNYFSIMKPVYLARRISGGGTVYHDLGNINFSVIKNIEEGKGVSYKEIATPVVNALNRYNLNIQLSERNDLLYNNLKLSGSAMHIFKNRVIAHGTILFDTNLTELSDSLKNHRERYTDKAIKSVKSKVCNIKPYAPHISIDEIIKLISIEFFIDNKPSDQSALNNEDQERINQLINQKYVKEEWIYGYSPDYVYKTELKFENCIAEIELKVVKSIIKSVEIKHMTNNSLKNLMITFLTGKKHIPKILLNDDETKELIYTLSLTEMEFIEIFF